MRRSGQLRNPAPIARRRSRQAVWEKENVTELAYADEGEWQAEEAWRDEEETPPQFDEHELAEDASQYAEYDEDVASFSAYNNPQGDESDYDANYGPSQEEQWDDPEQEGDIPEERGLVAFHGRQTGALARRSGELGEYGIE